MNDYHFKGILRHLENTGGSWQAEQLQARDTAQRESLKTKGAALEWAVGETNRLTEALARVEAELEAERSRSDALVKLHNNGTWEAAEAQLAEAVGLLKSYGHDFFGEHCEKVEAFLARHAQAEQQEAPPGWSPCSPDLLKSGVCCESAPRIAGRHGSGVSHYHPAPKQEAQGAQAGDLVSAVRVLLEVPQLQGEQAFSAQPIIDRVRAALATQPPEFRWTCINHWFLSLDPNRQESLLENKWALASAAFDAGQSTEDAGRGAEHE